VFSVTVQRFQRRVLPLGSLTRKVALLAGSTAAAQGLAVAVAPALTRLYSPADFGELAVYSSLLSMLVVISSLRYHLAIPVPKEDDEAVRIALVAVWTLVAFAALTGIGVSLWNAVSDHPLQFGWLLPISVLAAGTYQVLSFWAIRKQDFTALAGTKFRQGIGQTATQLLLGVLGVGPLGLLTGNVVGQSAGSGRLAGSLLRQLRASRDKATRAAIVQTARRNYRFPLFGLPSSLCIVAALNLPPLLVAAVYGSKVAGLFILGQRMIGIPMRLLGQAIGQTYLGAAAQNSDLASLFRRTVRKLMIVGAPVFLAIGLTAPAAFGWVFGREWAEAGVFIVFLVPMFLMQFIVSPVSQTVHLLGRQHLEFIGSATRLLAVLAVFGAAYHFDWSARVAILGYSLVMAATYGMFLIFYRSILGSVPNGSVDT
jgi:O-antigen/teichoic acid export membrane protein